MSDEMRNIMGPADGQQKMRLMAHLYENTTPINDRRERYAAALRKSMGLAGIFADATPQADAAMTVADEELRARDEYWRGRFADKIASVENRCDEIIRENTRLRAEQREYDERFEAQNAEITRLRAELERERQRTQEWIDHSEKLTMTACGHVDTISRVRAACDREESRMIDPDKASIRTSVIRAALDAPNG